MRGHVPQSPQLHLPGARLRRIAGNAWWMGLTVTREFTLIFYNYNALITDLIDDSPANLFIAAVGEVDLKILLKHPQSFSF